MTYPNDNIILVGDFNAMSTIREQRPKGHSGKFYIAFASNANLEIAKNPHSLPLPSWDTKERGG